MSWKDKKKKMSETFENIFPNTNSVVSISGLKWSTKYNNDVDVDIIYTRGAS